jgi:hypothetical protein
LLPVERDLNVLLRHVHRVDPALSRVLKINERAQFHPVRVCTIVPVPPAGETVLYGLWVIDKPAIADGREDERVKQDFLVVDRRDGRLAYYSGLPVHARPANAFGMGEFHRLFGYTGDFGYARPGPCTNHHYRDENDDRLPREPHLRALVAEALDQAYADLGLVGASAPRQPSKDT